MLTNPLEKDKTIRSFETIFKSNWTLEDAEIQKQLKPGHPPIKQKTRPITYHLQIYVEKEINKLIQFGPLKKYNK